jgi:phosphoribosylamine--glycine ligase
MGRHHIPTASYKSFQKENLDEALAYLQTHTMPVVLKADGLAAGKGVLICTSTEEAQQEIGLCCPVNSEKRVRYVVVEQFLKGIEFSAFALTDGHANM